MYSKIEEIFIYKEKYLENICLRKYVLQESSYLRRKVSVDRCYDKNKKAYLRRKNIHQRGKVSEEKSLSEEKIKVF